MAWIALCGTRASATVQLAPVFGAGAVLQRGMPLTIWGTDTAAERITVELNGHRISTTASSGTWHVLFPAMKADGPVTLSVTAGNTNVRHDVWLGEVFLYVGGWQAAPPAAASAHAPPDETPPVRVLCVGKSASDAVWSDARSGAPSPAMYAFAQALKKATHTAVGLVATDDHSAPISAWLAPGSEPGSPPIVPLASHESTAFEKLIAPLAPYSFGAVILAPGAADLAEASAWRVRAGWLVAGWRKRWGYALPFVVVQAPAHESVGSTGSWPELREAELGASTASPGVALVVTADLTAAPDAAPDPNPSTVIGQRISKTVQMLGSGFTGGPTGPRPISAQQEKNQFLVTFDHTGKGLVAPGGELDGFEVQDKGGVWHQAEAFIRGGNTAIVFCEGVDSPAAVRYGWADAPQMNLANSDGAPASPFRLTP